jgi:tripartite-type tricarboxylate transporter receptor subunit TctC
LNDALNEPDVIERFRCNGAQVEPGPPPALAAKVRDELARWSSVVSQCGLAPHELRLATLE